MNGYRIALVLVLAFGLAMPTMAVSVIIDPDAFTKDIGNGIGTDRGSDAYQWYATSVNGKGDDQFGRDGGSRYGQQTVSVNADATVVHLVTNSILVGSILLDENGNIESYTGGLTSFVDDVSGLQGFKFITYPVTLNLSGYTGGWFMQDVNYDPRDATVWSYSLPVTMREGDAYVLRTPGTEARFTLGIDGKPTVTVPGTAGLAYDESAGELKLTNVADITYTWTSSIENENWASVQWWADWGLSMGGGDKKGQEGTMGFIPGVDYSIGWYSLDYYNQFGGTWDNRSFSIPADPTGWSQTFTYTVPPYEGNDAGRVYTLTLTGPAIPEPATMSLLTLGGLALLRRRR